MLPPSVTVPESLIPILEKHRQGQNRHKQKLGADYQDSDLIFCQENGEHLWPNTVSAAVSALCRRLGLPKGASLHSLRHTHASVLLEEGVPLTTVSQRLGHANVRIRWCFLVNSTGLSGPIYNYLAPPRLPETVT
jgi:integrase